MALQNRSINSDIMNTYSLHILSSLLLATFMFQASPAHASPYEVELKPETFAQERVYSPYAGREYPDQVLFGDAHSHTNLSVDAGLVGTKLDVDAAYRFASGEKVVSNTGQPVQLIRPLDFLVITDHAEFMGLAPMLHFSILNGRITFQPPFRIEPIRHRSGIRLDAQTGGDLDA